MGIPEKDNDDLGFALAAADIAVMRFKIKKEKREWNLRAKQRFSKNHQTKIASVIKWQNPNW